MAAASPEFFKPSAFSPRLHHLLLDSAHAAAATGAEDEEYHSCCRTPTDAHLGAQPATCPPAPRKPRPHPDSACRKRLFDVDVISLRFDDLQAIFRPRPGPDAGNNNKHKQTRRSQQGRAATLN